MRTILLLLLMMLALIVPAAQAADLQMIAFHACPAEGACIDFVCGHYNSGDQGPVGLGPQGVIGVFLRGDQDSSGKWNYDGVGVSAGNNCGAHVGA